MKNALDIFTLLFGDEWSKIYHQYVDHLEAVFLLSEDDFTTFVWLIQFSEAHE